MATKFFPLQITPYNYELLCVPICNKSLMCDFSCHVIAYQIEDTIYIASINSLTCVVPVLDGNSTSV